MECVFCKIAKGIIPSNYIYNDDDFFVINDVNPKAKIHILLIPHRHYPLLADANDNDHNIISKMLKWVSNNVSSLNLKDGYRIIINQGENGGQEVPHLHIHILGGEKVK